MKPVKIAALALALVLAGLAVHAFLPEAFPYPELKVFGQAYMLALTKFVDPVRDDRLMQGAQRGLLGSLDAFSTFVPAERMEAFRKVQVPAPLDAGVELRRGGRFAYANLVAPGSPAAEFLKPGDIVEAVNGKRYPRADLWELQAELGGPLGKSVTVTYSTRDSEKSKEAVIKLRPYARPGVSLDRSLGAPVLRIPRFEAGTAEEVRKALEPAGRGLLFLDLRSTTSFGYAEALQTAALFLPETAKLVLKSKREEKKLDARGAAPLAFSDLHVLADRDTTGAPEVFAALLQKGAGAKVVGRATYGYTGILQLVPLSDGGACHLTYTLVLLPDGTDLMGKGVQPDVPVRDPFGAGTASDAIEKKVREIIQEKALPKAS